MVTFPRELGVGLEQGRVGFHTVEILGDQYDADCCQADAEGNRDKMRSKKLRSPVDLLTQSLRQVVSSWAHIAALARR